MSGYRPPNTNASKFLREYSDTIKTWKRQKNHDLILGLDHNMDFLKSDKHTQTQDFLELNLDSDLKLTITGPTRVTTKTATLIDNVFLSQRLQHHYTSNILIGDISDHMPSIIRLKNQKKSKKEPLKILTREMSESKLKALNSTLSIMPWDCILNCLDADESFNCIHKQIQEILEEMILLKMKTISCNRILRDHWLTSSLRNCLHKQRCLYKDTLLNDLVETLSKYKTYRNTLQKLIRNCRTQYYVNKCVEFKNNSKKTVEPNKQ